MTTDMVAWFGQLVGALSISAALYLTLLHRRGVPIRYGWAFYVIGAVMMLMNLDPLFQGPIVEHGRLIGICIVLGVELTLLDHVRREYNITTEMIIHG